jgi:hypothetical protein
MAMRSWVEIVLKVVVMTATMCSGLVIAQYDGPVLGDEEHEEGRGIRQDKRDLDRAA